MEIFRRFSEDKIAKFRRGRSYFGENGKIHFCLNPNQDSNTDANIMAKIVLSEKTARYPPDLNNWEILSYNAPFLCDYLYLLSINCFVQ
jgi:hypothetical protein